MTDDSRLVALRKQMQRKRLDLYLVFLADYHASENVVEAFGEVEWLSGFSGTNATIVVSQEDAGLWTDGRYFIQARRQIEGSGVRLFQMGEENVPTVEEYIQENLPERGRIGFDARVVPVSDYQKFQTIAEGKRAAVVDGNLLDGLWEDRPPLPKKPLWVLPVEYAGQTARKKLSMVYAKIVEEGADAFLLTRLDDIAWLLNLRGEDIAHVPVGLCFFFMTKRRRTLYVAPEAVGPEVREYLKRNDIRILPYEKVFADLKRPGCKRVWIDPDSVSAALYESFPQFVKRMAGKNPTTDLKAKKNQTEIENSIRAHIKDGVAVTKFIYYIKKNIGKEPLSECRAAKILHSFRACMEHFLDESFDTISAYGANAAMMHYEPNEDRDVVLEPKGFLLVDSGGHYLEGTTDITRTICLGPLTDEERMGYTLTLRGLLRLMGAHFPKGTLCQNLDILARGPFWDEGLDYRCGTGHGVGHILSVHEGPNSFRWRITDKLPACELVPGMITTDEPGLYVEDSFGIRI
ncbi:MAG: aminopeptidase P family N-terminal domain-containing protein, partial [Lachnospiraceae bacterium]|nr:aminopeptidase P family N-terminal domain-containing protein [Lachnospiraceae bacterium]